MIVRQQFSEAGHLSEPLTEQLVRKAAFAILVVRRFGLRFINLLHVVLAVPQQLIEA